MGLDFRAGARGLFAGAAEAVRFNIDTARREALERMRQEGMDRRAELQAKTTTGNQATRIASAEKIAASRDEAAGQRSMLSDKARIEAARIRANAPQAQRNPMVVEDVDGIKRFASGPNSGKPVFPDDLTRVTRADEAEIGKMVAPIFGGAFDPRSGFVNIGPGKEAEAQNVMAHAGRLYAENKGKIQRREAVSIAAIVSGVQNVTDERLSPAAQEILDQVMPQTPGLAAEPEAPKSALDRVVEYFGGGDDDVPVSKQKSPPSVGAVRVGPDGSRWEYRSDGEWHKISSPPTQN